MSEPKIPQRSNHVDEGVPLRRDVLGSYPIVVIRDHQLCAGQSTRVHKMPRPHMHSQIEFNLVTCGTMTYWFDGHQVTLQDGRMAVFWGMIPHQVTDCAEGTKFVVLHVPMSVFLKFSGLSSLSHRVFAGEFLQSAGLQPHDIGNFVSWRNDLLLNDRTFELLVQDELAARLRRLNRDGWLDLRDGASASKRSARHDWARAHKVEEMSRFIGENAFEEIGVAEIAKAVGLHPKYAMALFKNTMGITIKQTLMRHRLDTARSMLITTDASVSTIALDCGFGSVSNFYAAFEKRFQISPLAFRKVARNGAQNRYWQQAV